MRKILLGLTITFLGVAVAACGTVTTGSSTKATGNAHWLRTSSTTRSVTIKILAGEQNGMNFNGYANGQMLITVPVNWHVTVDFTNVDNAETHSATIVPLQDRTLASIPQTAVVFPGATTPNPSEGTGYNISQSFHFMATRPGTYALACGVPGHALMGMWDRVTVSQTAKLPSITVSH
jgi:sulfocyanin